MATFADWRMPILAKKKYHLEEENIGNNWFQQVSATCHTAEATLDVLRPFLKIALSAAELMSFGHLGVAI